MGFWSNKQNARDMTVLVHIQRFAGEKLDSDRDHSVYNTALEAGLVTPEDSQPEQKRVDD